MKTYSKEIVEVHDEFNTAGEKLLQESLKVLKECSEKDIEKGKKLIELGFINTEQAKSSESTIKKHNSANEVAEMVNSYSVKYPNNKFIRRNQVEEICRKYNLICGPLNRFTGFVPEVKLAELENFCLSKEDAAPNQIRITRSWGKITNTTSVTSQTDAAKKLHKIIGKEWIDLDDESLYVSGKDPFSYRFNNLENYIEEIEERDNSAMVICAPEKDMNVKGLQKDGFFHTKVLKRTVPDPVILKPVRDGYLIVTAWGDEASDPIVVNERHN